MITVIEWNVKPQIATFDFIELRWYSLMFLLGFVFGYYILNKIFKKEGLPVELLDKLTFYVVISTIIGARLGHCLFYEPQEYLSKPLTMILPFESKPGGGIQFTGYRGLASHGGIVGVLLGLYLYARKFKRPYLWIVDRLAIVGALAGAFIRLGNFFNHEIVGEPTTLPWGVKFLHSADPSIHNLVLHPAQLYEAICYLIIFVVLIVLYYRKYPNLKPGLLTGLLFTLIFTARFFIEFVKDIQVDFEKGMALNMGQLLSIPFIALGLYMIFRKTDVKGEKKVKAKGKA
ncbi:MAG: prolipoprotein diacylglyceryl transferase [Bacteroidales bacterium]|nr:prolipoprotein diacylglyceryl transferase [Bacteroidales bacterium]